MAFRRIVIYLTTVMEYTMVVSRYENCLLRRNPWHLSRRPQIFSFVMCDAPYSCVKVSFS